jgi:menaquinone-dependent protoporphyrinogen IX oxidase
MNRIILVTYATRTSATQGVAEGSVLAMADNETSVKVDPLSELDDLSPDSAMVEQAARNDGAS